MSLVSAKPSRRLEGLRTFDILSLVYVTINLVVILYGFQHIDKAGWVLAGFAFCFVAIASLQFLPRPRSAILRHFRAAYPLWLLPLTYKMVGVVNKGVFQGYFDEMVMRWDRLVFRGHPNTYLAEMFPSPLLSEFLHLCYYGFYFLIPLLGLTLYLRGYYRRFRVMTTEFCAAAYACYLAFIFFPVQGPWYTFPRITAPGEFFPPLVYNALDGGAAVGAAFPSSHVACAVVVTALAIRFSRKLGIFISIVATGIFIGTVYGGFHYAIDALAGLVFGVLMIWLGPLIYRGLRILRPVPAWARNGVVARANRLTRR